MKQIFYSLLMFISFSILGKAQSNVADFESLELQQDSYWNGSDNVSSGFLDNGFYFPTVWNSEWNFWSGGFAFSNMRDTVTEGFTNMYSARAGSGAESSSNYILTYGDGFFVINGGKQPERFYITNNTYAYFSMLNGDGFSKKFGGMDGNDPDFFRVIFTYYYQGSVAAEQTVYLADFRFEDNSQDYIVKDWLEVQTNLTGLVDSVTYYFESSDMGDFGINTPTYFCIDQIHYTQPVSTINSQQADLQAYPNPAYDVLFIQQSELNFATSGFILDLSGKYIKEIQCNSGLSKISVSDLPAGVYFIVLNRNNGVITRKVIVQ